jgi:four helix bundle protein
MSRDPRNLKVFRIADELVTDVYQCTRDFPVEERYALQAQVRRAAVSVPTNIVEGSARQTSRDYVHFLTVARASASEVRYLLTLSRRLGFVASADAERLEQRYSQLLRGLQSLVNALSHERSGAPRPDA